YDDDDEDAVVRHERRQQPDQQPVRVRVRGKGVNGAQPYAAQYDDRAEEGEAEAEETGEEGFVCWGESKGGRGYLGGSERRRPYHALVVDTYDESDQPDVPYIGRVPYNVSRAGGHTLPSAPLPRPAVQVRSYVRPASRFYRRHSPRYTGSYSSGQPTTVRHQHQREQSISSGPGSPASSGEGGPRQQRFLAMSSGDADAVRPEHEPDRARTPPGASASIGATSAEHGPTNGAQPNDTQQQVGSGGSANGSGPPVASTGSSATVPSTVAHAPNGTNQQQQNLVNNNHNGSPQVDAPATDTAPSKPKGGGPLVRSKESVSPLPVKRQNGTGGKDTNNNAAGEGQRSPVAATQSTANGPAQTPTNPNQPTRPLGGIKGRKGGGWKARPDSESFGNALNSPTDEDELLGGSSPVTVRRQPINVNPVITRDKLASGGGGGSVGGSVVGGVGGGGGGWGPRQRGGAAVERGSRIQSPATGTTAPHLHGVLGGGGAAGGVVGGTSMDVGAEGASQPAAAAAAAAATAAATGAGTAANGGAVPGTAASTPGTAQPVGPLPVKRSQSRNDVLDLDTVPGPSGLLPSNPGVPGTIGGNPQSRYSNLSFWKARRVLFYRNGDPFFPGVEFRFKPGRDICTLEALLDKISARMDLPRGARYIFSMDGDRKYSLDELEDGSSYVVSSFKVFKVSGGTDGWGEAGNGALKSGSRRSAAPKSVSRLGC
uniref:Doublecortin domain-containing protein n=1 Tax=Anopheles maculatus TaxID=74869 RepID=A0A182T4T1_9DIPT